MFKYKNAMISMAVVAMLAACGGGGGGGDDDPKTGGSNGGSGGTPNQPGGSGTIASTADAKLATTFQLSGGQVLFGNGDAQSAIGVDDFTSKTPRTEPEAQVGGYGAYAQPTGSVAPLQSFGYRLAINDLSPTAETNKVGRVVFELKDQGANPQKVLRVQVNQVRYSVDANGTVTVTSPTSGTNLYVYAKNGAQTASVATIAPADVVEKVAIAGVDSDFGLVLDVNSAVQAAINASSATAQEKTVLNGIKDSFTTTVSNPFAVSMAFSNLTISRTADSPTLTIADLGADNTAVAGVKNGGGITGYLQVAPE